MVLIGAKMPAVVSEFTFANNSDEGTTQFSSEQRQRVAEGMYGGVANYLDGLRSASRNRQKLATENHFDSPSEFAISTARIARNPT